ncbi:hypothetical protein WDU99_12235 [Microbacterium sp. Mu-80]|uniref:Uncharacterized protein n=1 Tax=Microbacterium bandirmense TaxID=3122050 RepID=A0ABU8LFH5_9MICO
MNSLPGFHVSSVKRSMIGPSLVKTGSSSSGAENAGAAYYQLVVRGDRVDDPETVERLRAAVEVVWRGMVARGCAT